MRMNKKIIFFLAATAVVISACSKYEKLLKSSDYELKLVKAMEYYNKGDYTRSATLFDQIVNVYKGTVKADTVSYYQAQSYYKQTDYIMAGYLFKEFTKSYNRSVFSEECEYMSAYCNYRMSPRAELDQQYSFDAIDGFSMFLAKYPKSKYVPECQRLVAELRNKLIEKSYLNAKLYYNMGQYKASIIALRNSLNDYPDTKYREELMYLILKSSFLLAENSVPSKKKERYQQALDEYYSFVGEFADSKFKDEAEQMHQTTSNKLGLK